jgi:hypothetical protein
MTRPAIESFASYPIVGPTDSVMRFMRGETVFPEEIEDDQSRSDVWSVTKEQYERWRIIYPAQHPRLD